MVLNIECKNKKVVCFYLFAIFTDESNNESSGLSWLTTQVTRAELSSDIMDYQSNMKYGVGVLWHNLFLHHFLPKGGVGAHWPDLFFTSYKDVGALSPGLFVTPFAF